MIKLKTFIDAIHDAVVASNDVLTDSSVGIIAKFFKKVENQEDENRLVPETVIMKYPHITEQGIDYIDVNVPLLTLAPLTCPTIDQVEFSTKFEMEIVNDELHLNFSKDNKDTKDSSSNRSGVLKILISPQEVPEGLKNVIEGYERVLKSQIP